MRSIRMLCAVALAIWSFSAAAISYSSVVSFGDSLSDPGNAYAITRNPDGTAFFPPTPPYAQRFSNGKTAVEYLADHFGIATVPAYSGAAGGNNFAVGGALTGNGNFNFLVNSPNGLQTNPAYAALATTGISQQIAQYNPAGSNPASTLYTLWGGPNDFFLGFAQAGAGLPVDFSTVVSSAVTNMNGNIGALVAKGARSILIPNMPDLGLTPFALSQGASFAQQASALTDAYNAGLDAVINGYRTALAPAGVKLFSFDVAEFMRDAVSHPPSGISDVTSTCVGAGLAAIAGGCKGILFFDGVHPTTFAHSLLANGFIAAVPEPQTYASLLLGLFVVGAVLRRRAIAASPQRD